MTGVVLQMTDGVHPDWPPICLSLIRLYAAEPVTAEDLEVIRSMMRDLVDHPTEMEEAKRLEIEAMRRGGLQARARSAPRPSPPPAVAPSRPPPASAPPRRHPPAPAVAQGVFW
jgi:hypothetical protein